MVSFVAMVTNLRSVGLIGISVPWQVLLTRRSLLGSRASLTLLKLSKTKIAYVG